MLCSNWSLLRICQLHRHIDGWRIENKLDFAWSKWNCIYEYFFFYFDLKIDVNIKKEVVQFRIQQFHISQSFSEDAAVSIKKKKEKPNNEIFKFYI